MRKYSKVNINTLFIISAILHIYTAILIANFTFFSSICLAPKKIIDSKHKISKNIIYVILEQKPYRHMMSCSFNITTARSYLMLQTYLT